jgi:hypothetical protein
LSLQLKPSPSILQIIVTMFSEPFGDVSNLLAAAATNLPNAIAMTAEASPPVMAQIDTTELSETGASAPTIDAAAIGMAELYKELEEIPISEKAAYAYARQTKPEFVSEEELFKFLLSENLKAKVS